MTFPWFTRDGAWVCSVHTRSWVLPLRVGVSIRPSAPQLADTGLILTFDGHRSRPVSAHTQASVGTRPFPSLGRLPRSGHPPCLVSEAARILVPCVFNLLSFTPYGKQNKIHVKLASFSYCKSVPLQFKRRTSTESRENITHKEKSLKRWPQNRLSLGGGKSNYCNFPYVKSEFSITKISRIRHKVNEKWGRQSFRK